MDYKGQWLSELLFYWIILGVGGVSWVYGWTQSDFFPVFVAWLGSVALACIVCVPDWPFFNRNPIQWLPPIGSDEYLELKNRGSSKKGQ